jgi:dihydroorotase (multifunctional complex type)
MTGSGPVDLVLRSSRILTAGGWLDGAIDVRDGRVQRLAAGESLTAAGIGAAPRVLDVGDRLVLPGLVDSHAHIREPGFTDKEDWVHGSAAALAGGVTTVIDMPNVNPPPNTVERFEAHRALAQKGSRTDFAHNVAGTIPAEIPGLAAAGAGAFKVFMVRDARRTYPHMPGIAVDDHAELRQVAEAIADTGKVMMVHPHDSSLGDLYSQRAIEQWGRGPVSYARSLRMDDGLVMDMGIATMLLIQRVTGVRLHLLHVSTPTGLEMIRRAKAEDRPVTAEANPFHFMVVNSMATIEKHGPFALGQWLPEAHSDALWAALLDGTIDVIGSDHTPHTRAEKEPGWQDMFSTPGGSPTIQHYLSLLLTEASRGRISIERIVELCATSPARLYGWQGRKGAIEVGADADLVVVDADLEAEIREEEVLSKCGWTILGGRRVHGIPVMTIRRGEVAFDGRKVLAEPGSGRHVPDGPPLPTR